MCSKRCDSQKSKALPFSLFGLSLLVCRHFTGLSIDPAARDDGSKVLRREVVLFAVDDVFLHELVQLVKIEKGNHGVSVVCEN